MEHDSHTADADTKNVTWRGSTGLPWSDMTSDDIMSVDIMSDVISISEDDTGRPLGEATPAPTPPWTAFLLLAAADTLAVLLVFALILLLLAAFMLVLVEEL